MKISSCRTVWKPAVCILALLGSLLPAAEAQIASPLFARGYTVLPAPQKVQLRGGDIPFDAGWQLQLASANLANDVAVEALREDLHSRFNLRLATEPSSLGVLSLRIATGSVPVGAALDRDRATLERQAYRIVIEKNSVEISANDSTGLFYGVETFLQLLRPQMGRLWLPQGTIEDWPDLGLRHIYWDDNHHLEKLDELKRDIRQAAFYKINGFVIKLDGHFQYKSAPAVVEPYALSPAELQELTDYGLRYHVQVIPYLDGPAHIAFILKHPEYAGLREFPNSNYEICATNPAAYKLLQGMYQDLLDANKGVRYFYMSTDEPYYLGLAKNSQCDEATLAKKEGSVGQVFAHYVRQNAAYLHDRGRTVMFWGEYPLKPKDISALPSYLVNGEVYGPAFDRAFRQQGIRQMIYTPTNGEEPLFPEYFPAPPGSRPGPPGPDDLPRVPRAADILHTISFDPSRTNANLIGEINAGWSDEGTHPETFWLGYVASAAAGWRPGSPNPQETAGSFYSLFYGPRAVGMSRIYQQMSEQAEAWADTWDTVPSKSRKPIWGWSYGIYQTPQPAKDQTLPLPPAPARDLAYRSTWTQENAHRLAMAASAMQQSDAVLGELEENLPRAQFNRYNLEIYLSIAQLCHQNFSMIAAIRDMDQALTAASALRDKSPEKALAAVDQALTQAENIRQERNRVYTETVATWDERWNPRVEQANGRHFLHELDDVKDHLPDRTTDMSYLVYREMTLPFGTWVDSIAAARNQYARAHHLPEREFQFAWNDLGQQNSAIASQ